MDAPINICYNSTMSNYKRYYLKDYSYIFITMVTYNRQKILIDNIDLLRQAFKKAKTIHPFDIIAICVMQDHIHMIIKEKELQNFSKIVSSIKKYFSYNLKTKPQKENLPQSMQTRKEAGVWQRRFLDHIIRDENDFKNHFDYIHYNSVKHYGISPKDWEYSSFNKFVKLNVYDNDWCDFKNKNMDYIWLE